jgi:hypothetical protein
MSDRSHVSVDKTVRHFIVGWANGDGTAARHGLSQSRAEADIERKFVATQVTRYAQYPLSALQLVLRASLGSGSRAAKGRGRVL